MERSHQYSAAVLGSTGAIGLKLIDLLMTDERCSHIVAIARKSLPAWSEYSTSKLNVIEVPNLDNMYEERKQFEGCDQFFCCIGSTTNQGKDVFKKVDIEYPLEFAKIALEVGAKRFSLVSSVGANATSWFLYMKTKGEVEEKLKKIDLQNLTIARPALLIGRGAATRCREKFYACIPCAARIDCNDVGKALIENCLTSTETVETLENRELLRLARKSEL
ncbi:unnamed protein product [Moneuplotes crassus]|uniref:NAD(P)-binding domain-containing protein n=1 Tax=Euplotes crassus TaxID=5936 RepID=A0AAD1XXT0_EUPCR|nr:unnamed protein product [Moneuplotes crassus]